MKGRLLGINFHRESNFKLLKNQEIVVLIKKDIEEIVLEMNEQQKPTYGDKTYQEVYESRFKKYQMCSKFTFTIPKWKSI